MTTNVEPMSRRKPGGARMVVLSAAFALVATVFALGFGASAQAAPSHQAGSATTVSTAAKAVATNLTVKPDASFSYSVACNTTTCTGYFTVSSGYVRFDTECATGYWIIGAYEGVGSWVTNNYCGNQGSPIAWRFDYFG